MDDLIRLAAFNWLEQQELIYGDVLSRSVLNDGFLFNNERFTIIGPRGIWKPKQMELPLSITTILDGPYDDHLSIDGLLKYKYRGIDPYHSDNISLRELMINQIPLIYFHNIVKGKYIATWPAFIQSDDIENLTFKVAVESQQYISDNGQYLKVSEPQEEYGRRTYLTSTILQRLHQKSFRIKVLNAYKSQCTLCHLQHEELLDAAHIIPDSEEKGDPIVVNGLSLCKIHHAAFDRNILGISPDYKVNIRKDVLEEVDGPMLKHGIQSLENKKIILPRNEREWPDRERLEIRYNRFLNHD